MIETTNQKYNQKINHSCLVHFDVPYSMFNEWCQLLETINDYHINMKITTISLL